MLDRSMIFEGLDDLINAKGSRAMAAFSRFEPVAGALVLFQWGAFASEISVVVFAVSTIKVSSS